MGVGIGQDSSGAMRTVVGTSEPNGYLRAGVTLNPGEELATGAGHAETSILNYMGDNGIEPWWRAAGRPICGACEAAIFEWGAVPAGELRVP
jgi:filamentous hemagglutinin